MPDKVAEHREKAQGAQEQLTPSPACTSTTTRCRHRRQHQTPARGSSRSPTSTRLTLRRASSTSRSWAAATRGWTPARTTACWRPAVHRHAGGGRPESRLPRGDRLARRLDRRGAVNKLARSRCRKNGYGHPRATLLQGAGVLMKVITHRHPSLLIPRTEVFGDIRRLLLREFNQKAFDEAVGAHVSSYRTTTRALGQGVLRGLHYQLQPHAQGRWCAWYAAGVRRGRRRTPQQPDLRPMGGRGAGQPMPPLWLPPGFAHGFMVTAADFSATTGCTSPARRSARCAGTTRAGHRLARGPPCRPP